MSERTLTTLEYIVLGLISEAPQSGYSIISALEGGAHRWRTSPGAIYPVLKRLEAQQFIAGEIEAVHETRPRKVYTLLPDGLALLDDWLRRPLESREIVERHEVALLKFLFAEKRLTRAEVLAWLDSYAQQLEAVTSLRQTFVGLAVAVSSVHGQLVQEAALMELEMQRQWIAKARALLQAAAE